MFIKKVLLVTTLFSLSIIITTIYGQEIVIKQASYLKKPTKQFDLVEIDFSVSSQIKNPIANITTPEGKILSLPAFYSPNESLWKIRYTPSLPGKYYYCLTFKTSSSIHTSDLGCFKVVNSKNDGFIRKSQNNNFYLTFESKKPFFGIGHNIAWLSDNSIQAYERYFLNLQKNGCNLTRIWINTPWAFPIENNKLGLYNNEVSVKLDALLKLAEKYNIYVILVLDSYGSLMDEKGPWGENIWNKNPYNKINGGPCENPWDFFTNEQAKEYYKNRLNYIISRWSYSPNILAFELWNELDAPLEWTKEIAQFIRSINPHKQLITTSLGYPYGNNFDESSIWSLDEIDFIDRHIYANQAGESVSNLISINQELSKKYKKPIIVGEFGINANKSDAAIDKNGTGIGLHNSIWATALSGSFSTALNWWWAEYIKAKNLYPHYQALRNFAEDINWNAKDINFLKTTSVMLNTKSLDKTYSDVIIETQDSFGDMTYKEFSVDNNGNVSGGNINSYLHGFLKKDFITNPIFNLNYPTEGKFILQINMVSQGANLIIYLDGKKILDKEFPAGHGTGPWKKSLFRKDYQIYQCIYDTAIAINVPKGMHTIKLENTGKDWIKIDKITLTNYLSSDFANVHLAGLNFGKNMLFWIQNKEFSLEDSIKSNKLQPINNASFDILDLENGNYVLEWWDTLKGKMFLQENIKANNNTLKISLPNFSRDLACKIKKQ